MNYIVMNIKRMFKRKVNLVFMLISPFVLVTFASMMGGSSFDLKIAYLDNDKSSTSMMLVERMGKVGSAFETVQEEIEINLINNNYEVAVIIENGFEEALLNGQQPKVSLKSLQGSNVTFPVRIQVDSFVSSAAAFAEAAEGDAGVYAKALEEYGKELFRINLDLEQNRSMQRVVTKMSIGFLFMNMLYLACQTSSLLVEDKKKKIFYRIFSGPITTRRYMLNNIISFFIIMLIQIAVIMFAMFGIYNMYFGESLLYMAVLFIVFGLMSVSFGVVIGTFSKNLSVAGAISSLVIVPLSMLGGFFWDIGMMPEFLQRLSSFLPTSWGIKAAEELLLGEGLLAITSHLAALLLFTAGFFVLGALKKTDISG